MFSIKMHFCFHALLTSLGIICDAKAGFREYLQFLEMCFDSHTLILDKLPSIRNNYEIRSLFDFLLNRRVYVNTVYIPNRIHGL